MRLWVYTSKRETFLSPENSDGDDIVRQGSSGLEKHMAGPLIRSVEIREGFPDEAASKLITKEWMGVKFPSDGFVR